jgi:hypothetical protein
VIGTTLSDLAAVSNEDLKGDAGDVSGLNMIAARFRHGEHKFSAFALGSRCIAANGS